MGGKSGGGEVVEITPPSDGGSPDPVEPVGKGVSEGDEAISDPDPVVPKPDNFILVIDSVFNNRHSEGMLITIWTETETGDPVNNVRIYFAGGMAVTDENGKAQIYTPMVHNDMNIFTVRAEKEGYPTVVTAFYVYNSYKPDVHRDDLEIFGLTGSLQY